MFEKSFGNPHWLERTTGIFMSNNLRTSVQRDFPVVGNTIVPGWFHPDLVGSRVPRDPGQPDAPTRFIFASQVTGHKGINILLDAARMLLDQGATNFTVDIVGNGEVSQMLHRLAALGLQNNVQYLGLLSKEVLLTRFAQYDALVLPTWPREPFGFVIGEAAAAGCVPVMTTGIGASEWFLDGIDSLKISQTPTGAATAMLRLMSMPVPERDRMRGRARATATRFFKFKTALASVETVLQNAKSAASLSRADTSVMRALGSSLDVLTNVWSKSLRG